MATYVAKQAVRNGSLIAVNKRRTNGELVPYLKEASTGRYREAVRGNLLTIDNPAIKDLISIIEQIDFEPIGGDFGKIDPGDLNLALDNLESLLQGGAIEDIMPHTLFTLAVVVGLLCIAARTCAPPKGPYVPEESEKKKDEESGSENQAQKIIHYLHQMIQLIE